MKHKKHKKLKIAISVIIGVAVLGFALYKVSFNVLAPVVFDFVLSRNPDALLKLNEMGIDAPDSADNSGSDEAAEPENETAEADKEKAENTKDPEKEASEKKETKTQADNKKAEQPKSYSTETYIGTLTSADLAKVIKNISAADKTRIISICKSVVAAADMPRFAKMATKGMSGDDYAFAESYLRSHLSPAQKKEIMEIVRKYLGR